MKLAIMQPTFNPWIGYFDLIDYVDEFVFLDNVQLSRRSWQTRNKIKVNNKEYMFSIPLKREKTRDNTILKDVKISYNNFDFRNRLYEILSRNYKKSQYFDALESKLNEIIFYKTNSLVEYNINLIEKVSKLLEIDVIFKRASLIEELNGKKGDLILNICIKESCKSYISPLGSKEYLDNYICEFEDNHIKVSYQYYEHQQYKQIGKDFISYLGILDLILTNGIEESKKIIRSGRKFK